MKKASLRWSWNPASVHCTTRCVFRKNYYEQEKRHIEQFAMSA
jgi:hypothetical protein